MPIYICGARFSILQSKTVVPGRQMQYHNHPTTSDQFESPRETLLQRSNGELTAESEWNNFQEIERERVDKNYEIGID